MHPEQIKAELRMRGYTMSALADSLRITPCVVSQVVAGYRTSAPVKEAIAKLLGKLPPRSPKSLPAGQYRAGAGRDLPTAHLQPHGHVGAHL